MAKINLSRAPGCKCACSASIQFINACAHARIRTLDASIHHAYVYTLHTHKALHMQAYLLVHAHAYVTDDMRAANYEKTPRHWAHSQNAPQRVTVARQHATKAVKARACARFLTNHDINTTIKTNSFPRSSS